MTTGAGKSFEYTMNLVEGMRKFEEERLRELGYYYYCAIWAQENELIHPITSYRCVIRLLQNKILEGGQMVVNIGTDVPVHGYRLTTV